MTKRLLSVGLLLLLLGSFVACDDDDDPSTSSGQADDDNNDAADDDTSDDDTADDDNDDAIDDDVDDDDTNDDDTGDDDTTPGVACYLDGDGDGFGDPGSEQFYPDECPPERIDNGDDCNDADPDIFPGSPELAEDGVDQDCSGLDLTPSNEDGVFVAKTGNDDNPGTMAEPKLTIAAGVALAASEGKVVFIARGSYDEVVETSVALYGGYKETDWTRNIARHKTNIAYFDDTCFFAAGEALAIEGINFLCLPVFAVAVEFEPASLARLHRNVILGGMDLTGARTIIADNLITAGPYHEAINADQTEPVLVNNMILGEAGLSISASTGVIVNNTFVAVMGKGASSVNVSVSASTIALLNNIFLDNSDWPVRSVSIYQTSEVTLLNNHFWGEDDYTLVDPLTDIADVNACTWDSCAEAGGNQFAAPLLGIDGIHLLAGSPCIDAGLDPSPWYAGLEIFSDFDGDVRPQGEDWDIGMDEFTAE